ncbi:hypothetical protein [Yinghuangia seranimata]|uniref:hypothetical protein n=1 Tax=Yinghuangia seranimata TaxID=408067 RepID=UPI00248AE2F7|nr:hypothetical protein [Yinghuangia seranimata]MDI2129372.1 hypothetical protein [Yinghuangia seranimata]
MNEIRMVLAPQQRVMFLVLGGVFLALGALNVALGLSPVGVVPLAVGVIQFVYYFWFASFHTTLTPWGLVAKGFTQQSWAWGEIAMVEGKGLLGGRYVRLTLTSGKRKRIRVPISALGQRDPEFDAKLAAIWQWWQAGVAQMYGQQPYVQPGFPQQQYPQQYPQQYAPPGYPQQQYPQQQYPQQYPPQAPGQPPYGNPGA